MLKSPRLPINDDDGALYEVHSDILADQVGEFMCTACFTVNDGILAQRYLMLTPDAQRLVRRCVERMKRCFEESEIEH